MRTLKTHNTTRGRRNNNNKLRSRRAHVSSRARVLRTCCSDGGRKLTEKLRALKSILPPSETVDAGETDQLFQETADYIVRLRTQVVLLQKLIEIYDDSSAHKKDVL